MQALDRLNGWVSESDCVSFDQVPGGRSGAGLLRERAAVVPDGGVPAHVGALARVGGGRRRAAVREGARRAQRVGVREGDAGVRHRVQQVHGRPLHDLLKGGPGCVQRIPGSQGTRADIDIH